MLQLIKIYILAKEFNKLFTFNIISEKPHNILSLHFPHNETRHFVFNLAEVLQQSNNEIIITIYIYFEVGFNYHIELELHVDIEFLETEVSE